MDIKQTIKQYVVENFLYDAEGIEVADDTSFLEEGIVDSTGVLELVMFLEDTFSITVEGEEMVPENLDSLNHLGAFVERKQSESAPA